MSDFHGYFGRNGLCGPWLWTKAADRRRYLVVHDSMNGQAEFVEALQYAVVDDFGTLVRVQA